MLKIAILAFLVAPLPALAGGLMACVDAVAIDPLMSEADTLVSAANFVDDPVCNALLSNPVYDVLSGGILALSIKGDQHFASASGCQRLPYDSAGQIIAEILAQVIPSGSAHDALLKIASDGGVISDVLPAEVLQPILEPYDCACKFAALKGDATQIVQDWIKNGKEALDCGKWLEGIADLIPGVKEALATIGKTFSDIGSDITGCGANDHPVGEDVYFAQRYNPSVPAVALMSAAESTAWWNANGQALFDACHDYYHNQFSAACRASEGNSLAICTAIQNLLPGALDAVRARIKAKIATYAQQDTDADRALWAPKCLGDQDCVVTINGIADYKRKTENEQGGYGTQYRNNPHSLYDDPNAFNNMVLDLNKTTYPRYQAAVAAAEARREFVKSLSKMATEYREQRYAAENAKWAPKCQPADQQCLDLTQNLNYKLINDLYVYGITIGYDTDANTPEKVLARFQRQYAPFLDRQIKMSQHRATVPAEVTSQMILSQKYCRDFECKAEVSRFAAAETINETQCFAFDTPDTVLYKRDPIALGNACAYALGVEYNKRLLELVRASASRVKASLELQGAGSYRFVSAAILIPVPNISECRNADCRLGYKGLDNHKLTAILECVAKQKDGVSQDLCVKPIIVQYNAKFKAAIKVSNTRYPHVPLTRRRRPVQST